MFFLRPTELIYIMRSEYEASSSICWRAVASSELLLTIIIRLLVVVDHDGFILDFNI